ncbi:hypothetical protein CU098_001273, partial [Rhizopus stolonifer]
SPKRLESIKQFMETHPEFEIVEPSDYSLGPILDVHEKDYIKFLATIYQEWIAEGLPPNACIGDTFATHSFIGKLDPQIAKKNAFQSPQGKMGYFIGDMSVGFVQDTWRATYASAQVVLSAAHQLMEMTTHGEGEQAIYALCRPPGHHASHQMSAGYCLVNNAAVAARFLQNYTLQDMNKVKKPYCFDSVRQDAGFTPLGQSKKILIVDIDFHHGNGTQDIFYEDPTVFYVSLHGYPNYPFVSGSEEEEGTGAGLGYNINVPLDPNTTTDKIYLYHLDHVLNGTKVVQFKADIVIVSMGLDTWHEDPIAGMKGLQDMDAYKKMGQCIKTSQGTRQRPVLFVQEGGYTIDKLGDLAGRVLQGYSEPC